MGCTGASPVQPMSLSFVLYLQVYLTTTLKTFAPAFTMQTEFPSTLIWCPLPSAVNSATFTPYSLHSTPCNKVALYSLHLTHYTLLITLYSLHLTHYTAALAALTCPQGINLQLLTLYTLHLTLYTLHSTLYTLPCISAALTCPQGNNLQRIIAKFLKYANLICVL